MLVTRIVREAGSQRDISRVWDTRVASPHKEIRLEALQTS